MISNRDDRINRTNNLLSQSNQTLNKIREPEVNINVNDDPDRFNPEERKVVESDLFKPIENKEPFTNTAERKNLYDGLGKNIANYVSGVSNNG